MERDSFEGSKDQNPPGRNFRMIPSVAAAQPAPRRDNKRSRDEIARRKCVDVAVLLIVIAHVNTLMLLRAIGGSTVRLADVDDEARDRLIANELAVGEQGILELTPLGRQFWLSIRGLIE